MAVSTDAADEQLDAAILLDLVFVTLTLFDKVFGVAVEDIGIGLLDINVAEEIVPHK